MAARLAALRPEGRTEGGAGLRGAAFPLEGAKAPRPGRGAGSGRDPLVPTRPAPDAWEGRRGTRACGGADERSCGGTGARLIGGGGLGLP
ncbi:MAG: hypothetical protein LBG81_05055 [Coriobacteriaceae bacterium]|nr:hypothetical protein [Coriobacteriaceae bacterium]